jgi:hypothetical protein
MNLHPSITSVVAFCALLFALVAGPGMYGYQSCTQGFPNTAMLPDRRPRHTLVPPYKVNHKELENECRQIWGQDLPGLRVPAVAGDVRRLVREVGGVVFTNGEFDGERHPYDHNHVIMLPRAKVRGTRDGLQNGITHVGFIVYLAAGCINCQQLVWP